MGVVSLEQLASFPSMTIDEFVIPYAQAAPSVQHAHTTQHSAARAATMPSQPNPPETKPKATKSRSVPDDAAPSASTDAATSASIVPSNQNSVPSTAVVSHTGKKGKFIIPRPEMNGAVAGVLNNKKFVLTGVFPEVGGGSGLVLGKDRVKEMIESFGGRVTSSVSGKTDFVLVGQEPGFSKVTQAQERGVPLLDLLSLRRLLMGQQTITVTASAPPPRITNFSAGYPGQKRISYY